MKKQWKQGCNVTEHPTHSFGNGAPMFPAYTVEFRLTNGQMETLKAILADAVEIQTSNAIAVDLLAFFTNALINKVIK